MRGLKTLWGALACCLVCAVMLTGCESYHRPKKIADIVQAEGDSYRIVGLPWNSSEEKLIKSAGLSGDVARRDWDQAGLGFIELREAQYFEDIGLEGELHYSIQATTERPDKILFTGVGYRFECKTEEELTVKKKKACESLVKLLGEPSTPSVTGFSEGRNTQLRWDAGDGSQVFLSIQVEEKASTPYTLRISVTGP